MKELCECKHAKLTHDLAPDPQVYNKLVNQCLVSKCPCEDFKEISNFGRVAWTAQNIVIRNMKYYFWLLWARVNVARRRVWKFVSYDYPIIQVLGLTGVILGLSFAAWYFTSGRYERKQEQMAKTIIETKNVQCYAGSLLLYDGPVTKYKKDRIAVQIETKNEFYLCTSVRVYPR